VSAWPYVDGCEADPARSERENVGTVENVIAVARPTTKIVYFSTDHVFDGAKHAPYLESDAVHPLSVYARHKRRAEEALLARENTLVVRTAWVFGREIRRKNFVYQVIDAARSGTTLLVAPQAGAPTWTGFLCGATLDLVGRGLDGIVHLTGGEVLTKLAWAALIARELELASFDVRETTAASAGQVAPRPERVALASERHELRQPELGSILRALARRGSFV
jgi:dTDP-4-dehydrorhamnose reductase